jgi:pyridoxal phosphate enzyme (YggS family)
VAVSLPSLEQRLARVNERIAAAGGDPGRVRLVAVTKGFGPDAVDEAVSAGLLDLGENYADELLAKAGQGRRAACRWHFLGRVQRNKVRRLAGVVHLWQGVDRLAAAEEVARRAPGSAVLVQVNVSGEPQKQGCPPGMAAALVGELCSLPLVTRGLMAVGPAGPPERARAGFRQLRELADELELPERSMGMSDDLEVAVEEGSTMVRLGRALFGPRLRSAEVRR